MSCLLHPDTLPLGRWWGEQRTGARETGRPGLRVHEAGAPEGQGCGQYSGPAFTPKPSSAGERRQAGATIYLMDSAQGCCALPPRSSGRRRAGEGLHLHRLLSCRGGVSGKAKGMDQLFPSRLRAV